MLAYERMPELRARRWDEKTSRPSRIVGSPSLLGLDAGEDLAFIRTEWRARLAGVLAGAGAAERAALEIDLETLYAPVAVEETPRGVEPLKRKAAG